MPAPTTLPIPNPADYDISPTNGFLPTTAPLPRLRDTYYAPWEDTLSELSTLILSGRLRSHIDRMPVLDTKPLGNEQEQDDQAVRTEEEQDERDRERDESLRRWRRAYTVLAFLTHAYIWGGRRPTERVPPSIAIPFVRVCCRLELPPVATFAGVCLWNWRAVDVKNPTGNTEYPIDDPARVAVLETFTGALDERWFYTISIAIEAQAGPAIPSMLSAIAAARAGDVATVTSSLQALAERLDAIGRTLARMPEHCDPRVFYHRIRPFLAGGRNMAAAGLPQGVIFDDGGPMHRQRRVRCSGGSNAQSSAIQFFDLVLGVDHAPTRSSSSSSSSSNFIHDMRAYMPGPHARFLARVAAVANLRAFVHAAPANQRALRVAYDACIAALSGLRDKHLAIVARYIVVPQAQESSASKPNSGKPALRDSSSAAADSPRGTGGSSLIPFLRQARNETRDVAVEAWARDVLARRPKRPGAVAAGVTNSDDGGSGNGEDRCSSAACQGLAGVWRVDGEAGGLCVV